MKSENKAKDPTLNGQRSSLIAHRSSLSAEGSGFRVQRSISLASSPQPLAPAAAERRGVLILVVLSLLVMFALMAMTYVLLASKHYSTAKTVGRTATNEGSAQKELETALMQLLRDTTNEHSSMYGHGLLPDVYGEPTFRFDSTLNKIIYGPNSVAGDVQLLKTLTVGDQLIEFEADAYKDAATQHEFSKLDGYYEGCVLTMTTGRARNLSTRIVRYYYDFKNPADPTDDRGVFRVMAFKSGGASVALNQYDRFMVNGRPFSGTGFGYNPRTGRLDAQFDTDNDTATANSVEHALLIHAPFCHSDIADNRQPATYNQNTNAYAPMPAYPDGIPFGGMGGANEDQDSPDLQNLALSYTGSNTGSNGQVVLPSFHRPDLIKYWQRRMRNFMQNRYSVSPWDWNHSHNGDNVGEADGVTLLRKIMLRPSPFDHFRDSNNNGIWDPNEETTFTGSNPQLDTINRFVQNIYGQDASGNHFSPWDVDNNGDGIMDSVWIDLGFPVRTTLDGRKFKPLFAIYCVDLDGRINVNAHGNLAQADWTTNTFATDQTTHIINGPFASNAPGTPAKLPLGLGFGTAEINLGALFDQTEIGYLLNGNVGKGLTGRYGGIPGSDGYTAEATSASLLAGVKHFQYPDIANNPPTVSATSFSSYLTTPDLWGRTGVGLDLRGQPIYWKAPVRGRPGWAGEVANTPYDFNLSRSGAQTGSATDTSLLDNPFTVFDLERILRPYDIDTTSLSGRLVGMESSSPRSLLWQNKITTASFDMPSPGVIAPVHLQVAIADSPLTPFTQDLAGNRQLIEGFPSAVARSPAEMLAARLSTSLRSVLKARNPTLATPANRAALESNVVNQVNLVLRSLLPSEVVAGLRMNINRPLGDGRDSNQTKNGVVDEPSDFETPREGKDGISTWEAAYGTMQFDLVNGTDVNNDRQINGTDQLLARQLLARHFYMLARLAMDEGYLDGSKVKWFSESTLSNPIDRQKLAIRRVAQWAINVVDYMDPDNIMTPFEYDLDPFTPVQLNASLVADPAGPPKVTTNPDLTWGVDGIIDPDPAANPLSDDNKPWRGLVWGCEAPALMLTETLAFHDRRVRDTKFDPSGNDMADNPPDPHPDQRRLPQGSLFCELYCPTGPGEISGYPAGSPLPQTVHSGDLYTFDPGQQKWYLQLGRRAPVSANGQEYPVWRLAISKFHTPNDSIQHKIDPDEDGDIFENGAPATSKHDTFSFDTEQFPGDTNTASSLLGDPANNKIEIERIVWFANIAPNMGIPGEKRIYYRQGGGDLLEPGKYAIVGPRPITRIGWTKIPPTAPSGPPEPYENPYFQPSRHKILLGANTAFFDHESSGDTSTAVLNYPDANTIQAPLPIVVAAGLPNGWTQNANGSFPAFSARFPTGIGISISEPLISSYYREPKFHRPAFDGEPQMWDCYGPLNEMDATDNTNNDHFLDEPEDSNSTGQSDRLVDMPVTGADKATQTGTHLNFKTVFVQRLANPLLPHDPVANPYLTVDWMPVDLTVFNGEANVSNDPDDPSTNRPTLRFASRQRGKLSTYNAAALPPQGTNSNSLLWCQHSEQPRPTTTPDGDTGLVFDHQLSYFETPPNLPLRDTFGRHSMGFLNTSFGLPLTAAEVGSWINYKGDPRRAFAWLPWNNRPYANVSELLLVPASHPGRMLHEFGQNYQTNNQGEAYKDDITSPDAPKHHSAPYPYLLNFLHGSKEQDTDQYSPNLAGVLEFMHVPSPFVGTETVLKPEDFDWTGGIMGEMAALPVPGVEPDGTAGLHPPFNTVSNFRDPGKVNINTISQPDVWNAILGGEPNPSTHPEIPGPPFEIGPNSLAISRRGYGIASGNNPYSIDGLAPSIFSNPFRSAGGADKVPLTSLVRKPVNATLWRAAGEDPDANLKTPLLSFQSPAPDQYYDFNQNPYFTFQAMTRTTSKLTTRSNVYAVWITVGYFEVEPAPKAAVANYPDRYPDGYMLGQELGADTGEIKRHRGFYIFDRSIPVGYERGQDHNVMDAVLLRRLIE